MFRHHWRGARLIVAIALVFTALAGISSVAIAGDGIFRPHPTTPAFGAGTGWTSSIALGDLNGDNYPDAVVASLWVEDNTVWMNDGAGNFTAHPETPTFGEMLAIDLALADLNDDGHLDAFITTGSSGQVFLNDGQGNLTELAEAVPSGPLAVAAAVALGDLDGDDAIDAVVTYLGESAARVFLGNGDGTFISAASIPVENSHDVALGYLNDDAFLDAVFAGFEGDPQSVWFGVGDGTFQPGGTFGAGNSRAIALGDINGDTFIDIVVANDDDEPETVWLNNGTGTFSEHPTVPSFGEGLSRDIALADIDGDGDLDAIVANEDGQAETVWLNDGTGAFEPHPTTPSFGEGVSLALAVDDIDDDGDLDVVIGNFGEQQTVWLNSDNASPVADAGGPYAVAQGESVGLDGTGSFDPDAGDTLTYEWDLDGDGIFGETGAAAENGDEVGATPTFEAGALTGPLAWQVTLRVTDSYGASSEDTAIVSIDAYVQGCLYAGALSNVSPLESGETPSVTCARGTPVAIEQGEDIWACLYAGALTQVGYSEPLNCGRGEPIGFAQGDDLLGCLYAGRLSQLGLTEPDNCGRGELIGLELAIQEFK